MNTEIYSHFHPDERPFIDKASEWVVRAAKQHQVKQTDFLDPRQQFILTSLIRREQDVHCRFDGGYPDAERKRALIAPVYRSLDEEDLNITVLSITSDDGKLSDLEHGDYMGAILGLGIKRDKIGDFHVSESGCHSLIAGEMADYIRLNLQQVHRVHVHTNIVSREQLKVSQVNLEEMNLSVASMRLDGIAGDVYRLSRAKVIVPIKAGRCRVNWKVVEDPSTPLKQGDMVSMQGFGRFKVIEVGGTTKSGRIRVKAGRYS